MKISTKGRYGLRTLIDIARHQSEGAVTLGDISKRQKISAKYLWQVINPLKTARMLRVTRGAKGGFFLTREPEEITLYEIVATLEGDLLLVDCLGAGANCEMAASCVARTVWHDVSHAMETSLKSITLADILKRCEASAGTTDYMI
jgi:Rrf2 family protein